MFPAGPITARGVSEDIKVTLGDNKEYVFPAGNCLSPQRCTIP